MKVMPPIATIFAEYLMTKRYPSICKETPCRACPYDHKECNCTRMDDMYKVAGKYAVDHPELFLEALL